jgi:hypothetical protein
MEFYHHFSIYIEEIDPENLDKNKWDEEFLAEKRRAKIKFNDCKIPYVKGIKTNFCFKL